MSIGGCLLTDYSIESLNSTYHKLNRQRNVFLSDQALLKAFYLAPFALDMMFHVWYWHKWSRTAKICRPALKSLSQKILYRNVFILMAKIRQPLTNFDYPPIIQTNAS